MAKTVRKTVEPLSSSELPLKNPTLRVVNDEVSYNTYVDAEYRAKFDYNASKDSLPWLVCGFVRTNPDDKFPIGISIKEKGSDENLIFGGTSANVGTISEDKTSLLVTAKKYVMLEAINDLGVEDAMSKIFDVEFTYGVNVFHATNEMFEVNLTVKPENADLKVSIDNGMNVDTPKQFNVFDGTVVDVEVNADYYLPVKESFVVNQATTKDYVLKKPVLIVNVVDKNNETIQGCTLSIANGEVFGNNVEKEVNFGGQYDVTITLPDSFEAMPKQPVTIDKDKNVLTLTAKENVPVFVTVGLNITSNADTILVNDGTPVEKYVVGSKLTIKASGEGLVEKTIEHTMTAEDPNNVEITLESIVTEKKVLVKIDTTPEDATITIDDVECPTKEAEFLENQEIKIVCSKVGYVQQTITHVVTEDSADIIISLTEEVVAPGGFVEMMTPLIEAKACYSYLNCGRFFKQNGINEESLKSFYKEFGYFVMSKSDYEIWGMLNEHFGNIEGVLQPEKM